MLISLNYLIKKYDLNIFGLSHFGAHLGQEINTYLENEIVNIHLFEPQAVIFNQLYEKYKEIRYLNFYNFGLGNENKNVIMYLDNSNSESSSILKPKTHLDLYPNIGFEDTEDIEIKIYDDLTINNVNFLNIDIQGYELEALIGCKKSMDVIDYIYTEINNEEVYEDCVLVKDLDKFLDKYDFVRVETSWYEGIAWGDAFYIKKTKIGKSKYIKAKIFNFLLRSKIFSYINYYFKYFEIKINKQWYKFKQKIKSYIR